MRKLFAINNGPQWFVINGDLKRILSTDSEELAKVFAAAPDMLRVCEGCHRFLSMKHKDEDKQLEHMGRLAEVIKKAQVKKINGLTIPAPRSKPKP